MPRPRSHRYALPPAVRRALEQAFGERVDHVEIVAHSRWARLHRGMRATTRRNRILLSGAGEDFARDAELLLHEFFHVLRQWQPRRLSRTRYVIESLRRGYLANRFEIEAREFAAAHAERFRRLLREHAQGQEAARGDGDREA